MPRHPPCALNNLATKMLASTVQFSKNNRTPPHPAPPTPTPGGSLIPAAAPHHPHPEDPHTPTRVFPQDPTACRQPTQRTPGPSTPPTTHRQQAAVLTPRPHPAGRIRQHSTIPRATTHGTHARDSGPPTTHTHTHRRRPTRVAVSSSLERR